MPDYMPKGGVKELLKSSNGRRYLAKLQERHALDILQPSNPKFEKVYGQKIKQDKSNKERDESLAKSQWGELKERKKIGQWRAKNPGLKLSKPK